MQKEFEEADSLLDANRDAVTISIEDEDLKAEKQRKATDGDPLASDDNAEVCAQDWIFFSELMNFVLSINE